MVDELIRRSDVIDVIYSRNKALLRYETYRRKRGDVDLLGVIGNINALPTIDAEPIKHGRWIAVENGNDGDTKCSRCGCYHHVWEAYGYYCQHCGAKMDEVTEDAD